VPREGIRAGAGSGGIRV